jgi:muramidase (phage lysozyme)
MHQGHVAALVGVGLLGAALLMRRAADAQAIGAAADAEPGRPEVPVIDDGAGYDGSTALDWANPWGYVQAGVERQGVQVAQDDQNVRAFLTMIATAEGTEKQPDPYRVCYAYSHTVGSFADHPAITGEWHGAPLPDAMCRGAGLSPGCVSTAAGRYQMIKPTWLACKRALRLPNFGPDAQDQAAVYLLKTRGALDDVKAGRFADAVRKVRQEWASMPGAGYGQPERKLAALQTVFEDAGGVMA